MYPSGEMITPLPRPCSICGCCRRGMPNGAPTEWAPRRMGDCCISGWSSSPSRSNFRLAFEATVTFTIAGVTLAASDSIARSSESNASTL